MKIKFHVLELIEVEIISWVKNFYDHGLWMSSN
jgi:hypothetical protein